MIVRANKADHARLAAVWESAVQGTHDFLTPEDFEFYRSRIPAYFAQMQLYAWRDTRGEVHGFIGVSGHKIEMLFVDNAFRGRGIGRQLLEFAIEELNADKVDVNEQNGQALGFYERVGRIEVDGEGKPYPILHLERPE